MMLCRDGLARCEIRDARCEMPTTLPHLAAPEFLNQINQQMWSSPNFCGHQEVHGLGRARR